MSKMKTRKSATKRFKITKNGKVLRGKSYANHKLEKKSPDQKRGNTKSANIAHADMKNVKKMIGA